VLSDARRIGEAADRTAGRACQSQPRREHPAAIAANDKGSTMEQRTGTDPDRELERTGDELEERIDRLDEHIGEAQERAQARKEDPDDFEDVAGDWEDTDDGGGGEDPTGFDDPDADEEEEEDAG
jgi:hypothetical protein